MVFEKLRKCTLSTLEIVVYFARRVIARFLYTDRWLKG